MRGLSPARGTAADRAASRERDVAGRVGLVPGAFSFGEKLLPLFLLSRKVGLCLRDKKPHRSTSSRPGLALCMFFLCGPGFTYRQRFGADCKALTRTGSFFRCYFRPGPTCRRAWLLRAGTGQRGLRRRPSRRRRPPLPPLPLYRQKDLSRRGNAGNRHFV